MKRLFFYKVTTSLLAGLGLLLPCACNGEEVPPFVIQLITSPDVTSTGKCPTYGEGQLSKDASGFVVRVTFFDAEKSWDATDGFLCDRLLDGSDSGEEFFLRLAQDRTMDVLVEAFQPGNSSMILVASGHRRAITFTGGNRSTIFVPRTRRLGCGIGSMTIARAFHTTTALPHGWALIAGGIVANHSGSENTEVDEGQGFYLTDSIELYNSQTGQSTEVTLPGIPRAFHTAFKYIESGSPDVVNILLVGGVGQGLAPPEAPAIKIRTGPAHPFRLSPVNESRPATAELITVDMSTVVSSLDTPGVTRSTEVSGWPEVAYQAAVQLPEPSPWAVVGGVTGVSNGNFTMTQNESAVQLGNPQNGNHLQVAGYVNAGRAGHTVTSMTGSDILVWGGNVAATDVAEMRNTTAELIRGVTVEQPPTDTWTLGYTPVDATVGAVPVTVFHTASRLSPTDVLLAGGFIVEAVQTAGSASVAIHPHDSLILTRLHLEGNQYQLWAQESGGASPMGFHAALVLPAGTVAPVDSVLITGGNPQNDPLNGIRCPNGEQAWTCALDQALIYVPGPLPSDRGTILNQIRDGGPLHLQEPRFGHTMTLLEGGSGYPRVVLVAGGIHRLVYTSGALTETVGSFEVLNLADNPHVDVLNRPPGQLYNDGENECRTRDSFQ